MRVAVVVAVTVEVVIVKFTAELPAGTVTVLGTTAELELDVRATTDPDGPAAPVRVTVPVEDVPPFTEVGETVRRARVAGVIVKVPV